MLRTRRTEYCRQQAAECVVAAAKTNIADVKEAYVNLEQAWLGLASDIADGPLPLYRMGKKPNTPADSHFV